MEATKGQIWIEQKAQEAERFAACNEAQADFLQAKINAGEI